MTMRPDFTSPMQFARLALVMLGVIIMLAPAHGLAQTFTILHTFTANRDGGYPESGLTIDRAGNLYGTTYYGGYPYYGTSSR